LAAQFRGTFTLGPVHAMGAKGTLDSDTMASTLSVENAVVDAVKLLGAANPNMPMTPERVWAAINQAS